MKLIFLAAACLLQVAKGQSLDSLRAAVEAQPDSLSAHQRYIQAFQKSVPGITWKNADSVTALLEPQYNAWMARFPQSATVPFALGDAYGESPRARPFLQRAVALDPKLAAAWADLSLDAERLGDFPGSQAFLKKAMDADTSNLEYRFSYIYSFRGTDPARYRQMSLDFVHAYPNSEQSTMDLYWLANYLPDDKDKTAIYDQLRKNYSPDKYAWTGYAMDEYFDLLIGTDPQQAVGIAEWMTGLKLEEDDAKAWTKKLAIARQVVKSRALLDAQKPYDAALILSTVNLERRTGVGATETVYLLKARALDAGGNTPAAFDSLLKLFAKTPSDRTRNGMMQYAAKLGKDSAWVASNVNRLRDSTSQIAPVFTLPPYLTHDPISLADYRGKVVLLTFWFPGCGPCRGEFPHFQTVLGKFRDANIVYLGINVDRSQDAYVLSFVRSSGYGFTPLQDTNGWAQQAYHVRGEPSNYLIDRQGRIVYSGFMIQDAREERMLELMIHSLL